MDNSGRGSSTRAPFLRAHSEHSLLTEVSIPEGALDARPPRTREVISWIIIAVQTFGLAAALLTHSGSAKATEVSLYAKDHTTVHSPFSINGKPPSYHEQQMLEATSLSDSKKSFYDPPTIYPAGAGLVSRVWHSNGSPNVNPENQRGSCWCSNDEFCMCTPSLAIDVVLTSGPDHVWLVQRSDNDMMALMGGFVEVGETVDEAARRELQEEMNLELPGQPLSLLGVYSDPKRDKRKHSVSVVYSLDIPPHIQPNPGDDAKKVVRVALKDIDDMEVWIDHKTILHDFIKQRTTTQPAVRGTTVQLENDKEPFKRSICPHS